MSLNMIKEGLNGQLEFDFEALAALTSEAFCLFVKSNLMGFSPVYGENTSIVGEPVISAVNASEKFVSEIFNVEIRETERTCYVSIAERWLEIGEEDFSPSARCAYYYTFHRKSGLFRLESSVSTADISRAIDLLKLEDYV